MKAGLSILLTSLKGTAGNVVAATWKGIQYFREHVTPANPNTPAQVAQRLNMSTVVSWFHDAEDQLKTALDALAEGRPLSGANLFVQRNVKDMADDVAPRIMPLTTTVNPVSNFVATDEADGTFSLAWDQGESTTDDMMYILYATYADDVFGLNLVVGEKDTTPVQGEAIANIASGNGTFIVFGLVETAAGGAFSVAVSDTVTVTTA